jgi:NAD(P)H-flavin reductase
MATQSPPPSARATVAARAELVPGRLFQLDLFCPRVAAAANPGQFVIIQATPRSGRVSLPIAGLDGREAGRLSVVFDAAAPGGGSLAALRPGGEPEAVLGPLGRPSLVGQAGEVLLVGEGAPAFGLVPLAQAMRGQGSRVSCLLAGEPECARLLAERLGCPQARVAGGGEGSIEGLLEAHLDTRPALVVAAGPLPLLRLVQELSARKGVAARVRLNVAMLDGAGMCGGCRVKVGGGSVLCCLEGAEFEASGVDLDYLERRERACRAS